MVAKTDGDLVATSNLTLTAPAVASLGGTRVDNADRVVVLGQTLAKDNGIYVAGVTGSELCPGGVFDGDGHKTFTVAQDVAHYWSKGAETVSLTYSGGTLTTSGWFVTTGDGGNITLNGVMDDDVLDSVKAARLTRATDADGAADFAESFTVSVGAALYLWEYGPDFLLGTSDLVFAPISNNPGTPWDPDDNDPTTTPSPTGGAVPLSTDTGGVLFGSDGTPLLMHY